MGTSHFAKHRTSTLAPKKKTTNIKYMFQKIFFLHCGAPARSGSEFAIYFGLLIQIWQFIQIDVLMYSKLDSYVL